LKKSTSAEVLELLGRINLGVDFKSIVTGVKANVSIQRRHSNFFDHFLEMDHRCDLPGLQQVGRTD
jgi:hypothetical protein